MTTDILNETAPTEHELARTDAALLLPATLAGPSLPAEHPAGPDALVGATTAPPHDTCRSVGALVFQHWLTRRRSFLAMFAGATQAERREIARFVARYLAPLCDLPAAHWLAVWEQCIAPDWIALLHDDPTTFHTKFDALAIEERSTIVVGLADRFSETLGSVVAYLGESRAKLVELGMLTAQEEGA